MAAPTLQAEGTLSGTTTTTPPTVTVPTHQADDILVAYTIVWAPGTVPSVDQIPTPSSGWALLGSQVQQPAGTADGWFAWWWLRASGAGTTITLTEGANWSLGASAQFHGVVDVVRGCVTSGNPWDDVQISAAQTGANPTWPACTVSGADRLVIAHASSMDNLTLIGGGPAGAGWTTNAGRTSSTGSDAGVRTSRIATSSSTIATNAGSSAPAQGANCFAVVSWKPPATPAPPLQPPNQRRVPMLVR